jgi:hypothetical protein
MRILTMLGALATLALTALPAMAQTAGATPDPSVAISSGVMWAAGVAAFVGFMLGSIRPNDEYAATSFDMPGAIVTAIAAGLFVGGLALVATTGAWIPAVYGIGLGALLGVIRFLNTRPAARPQNCDLQPGVNRPEGADSRAKLKAAEKLYNKASFHNGGRYYASRGRNWRYSDGIPAADLSMIAESASNPRSDTFDILVMLVRELPGTTGEPAVIVVRGGAQLRLIKATANTISVPGVDLPIPASSVLGMVGYAWR